ncbi:MAG: TlpA family protein disulfide reductase [Acidobacteria bacterium]|nr:TlpA family protein disulfide reductase [Acidobacteriota bacterium]
MKLRHSLRITAFVLAAVCSSALFAENTRQILDGINKLRDIPYAKRGAQIKQLAAKIHDLPASKEQVELAYNLMSRATEGEPGRDALQAATDAFSTALTATPIPGKKDKVASPYMELASVVRYEGIHTDFKGPELAQAMSELEKQDEAISKADFTLSDLKGKKVKLSDLRGKIVMVNFWATWCPPCRHEMPDLDAIAAHFAPQGLVILAITDEQLTKVGPLLSQVQANYHPTILLDSMKTVHKQFYIRGIPKTFIFNREGKLVGQTIDERSQHQFLMMLQKAGLDISR